MSIRAELIGRIEAYCRDRGIAESTFGLRAVNDGQFVKRLRDGGDITLNTLERINRYITDNPVAPEAA